MSDNPLRNLPSVSQVLATEPMISRNLEHSHEQVVDAIRREIDALRQQLRDGADVNGLSDPILIAQRALQRLSLSLQPKLRPVINATGIVLHTNLGRAPLATEAVEAAQQAAQGYLNLELDLETGKRSSRQDAIRQWLCQLTGAESATAVNNNAAATVLVLRALCKDKEAIVSRGQLVEIGGSFRIPDIMSVSGAILCEVGTTNITRLSDYEKAIGPNTGALLRIHASNFRISGFTRAVPLSDLVKLGKERSIPVIDDVGSGDLIGFERFGFQGEPAVRESVSEGADLVLFSGDKLLGGPQAGIILGKAEWISQVEKDPLMRAFRLDKMTLAALEATLRLYLNEERALQQIPTLRALSVSLEELRVRAETLAERLRDLTGLALVRVVADEAFVGGGSLPDQAMKTILIEVTPRDLSDEQLGYRLRTGSPAVLPRIREGKVLLDLRTLFPRQETDLLRAFRTALAEG